MLFVFAVTFTELILVGKTVVFTFEEKFEVIENSNRKVCYADKDSLIENILIGCGRFEEPLSSTEPDTKENDNISDNALVPKEHEGRTKLRKNTDK